MPNPFEVLGRGMASSFWTATKYGTKPFWGNWAGRVAAGGIIGGAYGGLTSDSATDTGVFKDVLGGAIAGTGIGLGAYGATKLGMAGIRKFGTGQGLKGIAKGVGKMAWRGGKAGATLGWKAARPALSYALQHPVNVAAGAAAIGGLGAIGYNMYSGLAGEESASYYSGRQQLMDSTYGLVQGMSANRH